MAHQNLNGPDLTKEQMTLIDQKLDEINWHKQKIAKLEGQIDSVVEEIDSDNLLTRHFAEEILHHPEKNPAFAEILKEKAEVSRLTEEIRQIH